MPRQENISGIFRPCITICGTYDLPLTTLLEVKSGGRTVPAIAVMSKASVLFLLNRITGKPIYPITETPVPTDTDMIGEAPSPTQPMSVTPPIGRTSFTLSDWPI